MNKRELSELYNVIYLAAILIGLLLIAKGF